MEDESEGVEMQPKPVKEKKGRKGKKKGNKTSERLQSLITKQEYQSTVTVVTGESQAAIRGKSDSTFRPESARKFSQSGGYDGRYKSRSLVLGAGSSRMLKSITSAARSKKAFASTTGQDMDSSYSSESSASEEANFVEKQKQMKKKKGKGKSVKLSESTQEGAAEKEERDTKKKKQDKKGKGKKETKDKDKEEKRMESAAEDDIMEQIMKLKEGDVKTESVVPSEAGGKEEKKKKKKGSKKKKDKMMTPQMAEQLRIEAEQEAIRQAELEKIRLAEERLMSIEKERNDMLELQVREEQLTKTTANIQKALNKFKEATKAESEQEEWRLWIECGKLPNPYFCNQMNTYLHIWEEDINCTDVSEASTRTENTLKLIGDLEELIATSPDVEGNHELLENWLWIRQLFRDYQQKTLDVVTYRQLRNVYKNLVRIDIPTADYNFKDAFLTLCLWLRVQLPQPLPNPRRPPKPRVDVTFKDLENMQIILPITMDLEKMALRAMYLKYDHLSDTCGYFYSPPIPAHYHLDLNQACKKEWRAKLKYKYSRRDKKPIPVIDPQDPQATVLIPEPEDFASDEEIPLVPYKKLDPTASDYAIGLEDQNYNDARMNFMLLLPDNVINLRKFVLLGGVYQINLLHQPPQPQDYVILDLNITRLFIPKELEHVDFFVNYSPSSSDPDVRKPPEEIEEDMKRTEEAFDSLIFINLTWPKDVFFLELPFVCAWDDEEHYWTSEHIHDVKHNEEKGTLSFRSQRFGTFGLATLRYCNLPYQAWEIKPEANGSVNISITTAMLIFEFNVQDGKICIIWVQNSPNNALKPYIGKYMKMYSLRKILKETGVDIFPEHDAFCYVEGSCEKHWPMEKNFYCNMAALSGCFNFAWSRWNLSLGRRSIVCLMREFSFDKSKQKNYSTLLVTPMKATIVNCTEVSQEFSDEPAETIKFSSDLYNLMKGISGIAGRKRVGEFSKLNVYAVSEFLLATRILSFS